MRNVRCFDNGGATIDRYTAVYLDWPDYLPGCFYSRAMSAMPFHPQGIGTSCQAIPGSHLGKRIAFAKLPEDCRKLVVQDRTPE